MVGTPVAAHDEEFHGRAHQGRARDADGERRPEADVVVEYGGDIAAREQQGRVGEVDDLGGFEDDDEAERDQRVDGADGESAEE